MFSADGNLQNDVSNKLSITMWFLLQACRYAQELRDEERAGLATVSFIGKI